MNLSNPVRCALALLAGALLTTAFAPRDAWIVAPLAIGVFYRLLPGRSPRAAAVIGFSFGVGYFGLGVNWVYHSLHLFGGAAALFAGLLTAVFVLVMTVFPMVTAWGWAHLRALDGRRDAPLGLRDAWAFASLWMLGELLRNAIMGGFPWILVGYSQTRGPLGELAPLLGVYGIGYALLIGTLCVFSVRIDSSRRLRLSVVAHLALIAGLTFWTGQQAFTEPKPATLGVRLAQANIPQAMKFSRERLVRSLDDYIALTQRDLGDDIDLVVWPETAIPTDFSNVDSYLAPMVAALDARGIDVLAGGFDRDGDDSYNAVRQLGGERQMYRKRHIVPFGEYLPLRGVLELFSAFIIVPGSDLSRGDGPHVPLSVGGESIGVSICYEDVFGEEMRALLPASSVLVNVSNDAWFGESAAPHQHEQKARMRAREMGRPMVRVTNTGVSSAIDYRGRILGRIGQGEAGVLDVRIQPRTGTTPYVVLGNAPVLGLASAVVLLILAMAARRSRRSPLVSRGRRA